MLLGFVALIAPWGGSSGLPKETAAFSGAAAAAVAAAVTTPAATVVANASRLDIILATPRGLDDVTRGAVFRSTAAGPLGHAPSSSESSSSEERRPRSSRWAARNASAAARPRSRSMVRKAHSALSLEE